MSGRVDGATRGNTPASQLSVEVCVVARGRIYVYVQRCRAAVSLSLCGSVYLCVSVPFCPCVATGVARGGVQHSLLTHRRDRVSDRE